VAFLPGKENSFKGAVFYIKNISMQFVMTPNISVVSTSLMKVECGILNFIGTTKLMLA
jgi:hypothetical protein